MDDLTPKDSRPVRLTCRHGFYLRITEDVVEGSKDESDQYSEYRSISFKIQTNENLHKIMNTLDGRVNEERMKNEMFSWVKTAGKSSQV